jgi:putative ABC transport system permease protein
MIWTVLVMALREIRRNTMRSILTGLGIVIGVAAVIAMVDLGESATLKITSDVSKMGSNMLTLLPGAQRRGFTSDTAPMFKMSDAEAIRKQIPQAARVAPAAARSVSLVYGNKNHASSVQGTTLDFFSIRDLNIEKGRTFNDVESLSSAPLCVIGKTIQKELFGNQDPVGESIRVGKLSCRILGVIKSKGQSTFGTDQDDFVIMPIVAFQRRLSGTADVSQIYISAKTSAGTDRVKSQLVALMRERRHTVVGQADDFNVMDMKEFASSLSSITGALTALLGSIAAVSLLVGGIGIMNIMLVSVTERTREIGIRLAIGARSREVLLQFLVEAVVLSIFGGLIGMAIGVAGTVGASMAFKLPLVISPQILLISFLFSAGVGVAFGFVPARRAARLKPIDALRHE